MKMRPNIKSRSDTKVPRSSFEHFNFTDFRSLRPKNVFRYVQRLHRMLRRAEDKVVFYKERLRKKSKNKKVICNVHIKDDLGSVEAKQAKSEAQPEPTDPEASPETANDFIGPALTADVQDQEGIVDFIKDIKAACETHQLQAGFVYEPTSGLYYDYNSGYYYNAEQGLYYDGNTGYYYEFDAKLNKYIFHSQAYGDPEDARTTISKIASSTRDFDATDATVAAYPSAAAAADSTKHKSKKTAADAQAETRTNDDLRHYRRRRRGSSVDVLSADESEEYHRKDSRRRYRRREESSRYRSRSREGDRRRRSRSRSRCKRSTKRSKDTKSRSRRRSRSPSDLEDGELSTNSCSSVSGQVTTDNVGSLSEVAVKYEDVACKYPPSLRIVVLETNLTKLRVGELFLITFKGGSLGREGDHDVIVPDINVSKFHLTFKYNTTLANYECVDMGSRNGTLLDGRRMSNAKQESEPLPVVHNSVIQLSQTKLLVHIHEGNATCDQCEPGLNVTTAIPPTGLEGSENAAGGSLSHKQELKQIKKRYGLADDKYLIPKSTMPNDRAAQRRLKVGSTNPNEKTEVASVDTNIAASNKGFQMLSKLGWSKGQKLGKNEQGILEPIPLVSNSGTQGLGSESAAGAPLTQRATKANALKVQQMRITQDRYNQSQAPAADDDDVLNG